MKGFGSKKGLKIIDNRVMGKIKIRSRYKTNLSEDGVFLLQLLRFIKSEEELTGIVVLASVCHGNQSPTIEFETLVKFIL